MITKDFTISHPMAHTLSPSYLGDNESGWTVKGNVIEDWVQWVNKFEAYHPTFGNVWGNFELQVYADSEEGYNDFIKNHPPQSWDYGDI